MIISLHYTITIDGILNHPIVGTNGIRTTSSQYLSQCIDTVFYCNIFFAKILVLFEILTEV